MKFGAIVNFKYRGKRSNDRRPRVLILNIDKTKLYGINLNYINEEFIEENIQKIVKLKILKETPFNSKTVAEILKEIEAINKKQLERGIVFSINKNKEKTLDLMAKISRTYFLNGISDLNIE